MKKYLANVLLSCAIILAASGVHKSNLILIGIGGVFVGVYNAIIYKQD